MNNLIDKYKEARNRFIETVNRFPEDKRTSIIFGTWSLKDVISHIIGWEEVSMDKVKAVKNGESTAWIDNVDQQNDKVVNESRSKNWEEVYTDLIRSGEKMIKEYQSLPPALWAKQAGPDPKFNPMRFLERETQHYDKHGREIKDFLKSIS